MKTFTLIMIGCPGFQSRSIAVRGEAFSNRTTRHLSRWMQANGWHIEDIHQMDAPSLKKMMDDLVNYLPVYRKGYDL